GGICQIRADLLNLPGPTEERRAQKDEGALLHTDMLALQVPLDHVALRPQPLLVGTVIGLERHRTPPATISSATLLPYRPRRQNFFARRCRGRAHSGVLWNTRERS